MPPQRTYVNLRRRSVGLRWRQGGVAIILDGCRGDVKPGSLPEVPKPSRARSSKSFPNCLALEAELNVRVAHLYAPTAEGQKIVNGMLPAAKDEGGDEEEES